MDNDKKIIIVSLFLVAVLAAAGYFFVYKKQPDTQMAAIKAKAEKFINEKLVAPGTNAKIKTIVQENGLYKVVVNIGSQDVTSYISQDGKNFFPDFYPMDATSTPSGAGNQAQPTQKPISKTDKPQVELFVMSYCPYGLQMEKGILPVVQLLGSKINYNLKFVSYIMHGEKEVQENMRQYCIGQQGSAKLNSYLSCFVKAESSDTCLTEAKINTAAVNACVSQTDAQNKITPIFKDQSLWNGAQYPPFNIHKDDNTKYSVSGSPTLVINGTTASAQRDPQSLLKLICLAFSNPPSECSQTLASAVPVAGFGEGTAANSNTANTGCATQ